MRKLIGITLSAVIIGIVVVLLVGSLSFFHAEAGRHRSVFGLKGYPDALEKGKM